MCGHILKRNTFFMNIFKGWISGQKGKGRLLKAYLVKLTRQANCNCYTDIKDWIWTGQDGKSNLQRQGLQ